MTSPQDYINAELGYLGVSGTDNIFNTWMWGQHVYIPEVYPWCAAFQSYVGVHDLGMDFAPSASASGVAFQGEPVSVENVQPGDWVLFNWDGRKDFSFADHIGLVEWIGENGYFGTIEGNSDDMVRQCTRSIHSAYSVRFFRPPYTGDNPNKSEFMKEEETMNVIVEHVNGTDCMAYFDGHDLHDLAEMDDVAALDKWYTEAYGKPMPRVDGGSKDAPWTSRIVQIIRSGIPSETLVPNINGFTPRS